METRITNGAMVGKGSFIYEELTFGQRLGEIPHRASRRGVELAEVAHLRQCRSGEEGEIGESFSYSKAFLCPVCGRYFCPRETLKLDSGDG